MSSVGFGVDASSIADTQAWRTGYFTLPIQADITGGTAFSTTAAVHSIEVEIDAEVIAGI